MISPSLERVTLTISPSRQKLRKLFIASQSHSEVVRFPTSLSSSGMGNSAPEAVSKVNVPSPI